MIKKTLLLVTAVMLAATSATYAAKRIAVENKSNTAYFYKVGNTVKKIKAGSSAKFTIRPNVKSVKIESGETKSRNKVVGNIQSFTLTNAEIKANPAIATNPVTGQSTPVVN